MLNVSDDFNKAMKAENRRFETRVKVGDRISLKMILTVGFIVAVLFLVRHFK